MHTLIKKIAEQAEFSARDMHIQCDNFQKFAELIVQECLDECWYDVTPKQIADNIKIKFGIEERSVPIVSVADRTLFSGIGSSESFTVEGAKKAFGVEK
jgi:hypothetical protein